MKPSPGKDTPLGRIVELRRTALGLKRKDLAERARLSYPYISEIENGVKEPSAKALRQIADALELTVAELAALSERVADSPTAPSVVEDVARPLESLAMLTAPLATTTVSNVPAVSFSRAPRGTRVRRDDSPIDPEVRALVKRLVQQEVEAWLEANLPGLIRAELETRPTQSSPDA